MRKDTRNLGKDGVKNGCRTAGGEAKLNYRYGVNVPEVWDVATTRTQKKKKQKKKKKKGRRKKKERFPTKSLPKRGTPTRNKKTKKVVCTFL